MTKAEKKETVKYALNNDGYFVIDHYNQAKSFSSFFAGVAGLWGIPMWVFYVNRGQCIASFGIHSKDKSIMEFQPANKSYRLATLQGFRTFIKIKQGTKEIFWEPFQNNLNGTHFRKKQTMFISAHDLVIEEQNTDLGLTIRVKYFTLPDEPFSGLVRHVTLVNTGKKECDVEIVDGMPAIVPYGLKEWLIKNMSRTVEAWIKVRNVEEKAPFYQLNVEVADTPQVTHITEGNFFFSFDASSRSKKLLPVIVENSKLFGSCLDFSTAEEFMNGRFKPGKVQMTNNKTPCAFSYHTFSLSKGKTQEITSVFGYARSVEQLNRLTTIVREEGFIFNKERQNKEIIDHIKDYVQTKSALPNLDLYTSHTFLDNILRGGLPISIKTKQGNVSFNVYSRKHGDLERDYNYFTVAPTYYSQGNGNFRDVNQNRRNDVWFNTDVRDSHIISFFNLSQTDGYNPLIVKGVSFKVIDKNEMNKILQAFIKSGNVKKLEEFLLKNFQPGDLLYFIEQEKYVVDGNIRDFLGSILEISQKQELADHGEGFWADHWTYNLDLVESYLGLYPETLKETLLDKKEYHFYLNHHYVRPRDQRFHLTKYGVRQFESVCNDSEQFDPSSQDFKLRDKQGSVYKTNLVCKILCLMANKVASLDPSGIGIEMEADKPGWYDALNGLPGLVGSSICESLELNRHAVFLLESLNQLNVRDHQTIAIFAELAAFIDGLTQLLSSKPSGIDYWNKSNDLKENYRECTRRSIDGKETAVTFQSIKNFLNLVKTKTAESFELGKNSKGQLATYFYHEVTDHQKLKDDHVKPLAFKKHILPLFLEGYVHALKVKNQPADARKLYQQVVKSDLFDQELKMFKVNASLNTETEEIGRTRVFPSGWLENESIWLHMEYKFLLELLRTELYPEFFECFHNVLIPFLKPEQYGRSILENSSFIVSSAHEDKILHGQGFVARLSGSTAEFLHIWLLMNVGPRPFTLNSNNELTLRFNPSLQGSMFTTKESKIEFTDGQQKKHIFTLPKNTYAFKFLNSTLVVYHNPKRTDTFGKKGEIIKKIEITFADQNKPVILTEPVISGQNAALIRERKASRIDIFLT
ncbi:MAG: hypothetical protein KBD53_07770 [Candidatus Omnitrophica bacterium]|nr:hypothetical protein [Candidatus Omnitrophota bacterium]